MMSKLVYLLQADYGGRWATIGEYEDGDDAREDLAWAESVLKATPMRLVVELEEDDG